MSLGSATQVPVYWPETQLLCYRPPVCKPKAASPYLFVDRPSVLPPVLDIPFQEITGRHRKRLSKSDNPISSQEFPSEEGSQPETPPIHVFQECCLTRVTPALCVWLKDAARQFLVPIPWDCWLKVRATGAQRPMATVEGVHSSLQTSCRYQAAPAFVIPTVASAATAGFTQPEWKQVIRDPVGLRQRKIINTTCWVLLFSPCIIVINKRWKSITILGWSVLDGARSDEGWLTLCCWETLPVLVEAETAEGVGRHIRQYAEVR